MLSNREIFSFVVGAGVGAVICYFASKDKFEKETLEEIESIKEYYKVTTGYKSPEEEVPEELKEGKKEGFKSSLERGEKYKSSEKNVVDYTQFYKKENKEKEEELMMQDDALKVPDSGVHVIFAEDYGQAEGIEAGGVVTFCAVDQTVVMDDGTVIADGIGFIGEGNDERFGEEEDNTLYIRDYDAKKDYEVVYEELTCDDYLES